MNWFCSFPTRPSRSGGEASEKLYRLGKQAAVALPALLRAVDDNDRAVRYNVVAALGAAEATGPDVVRALASVVVDADSVGTLRGLAASNLGRIGPTAEPTLINLLQHPDKVVRTHAADAIGRKMSNKALAVPELVRLLADEEERVRLAAASSLHRIGPLAEPWVRVAMEEKRGQAACYAAQVILQRTPDDQSAIRSLVAQLDDPDPSVRRNAAWFLQYAGQFGGSAVQRLAEALEDEDTKVRSLAAASIGDIGVTTENAEPALLKALGAKDPALRDAAAYALGRCRQRSAAAIERLAQCVLDPVEDVQISAIQALGRVGPEAAAAVPSLRRALVLAAKNLELHERVLESLRLIESEKPNGEMDMDNIPGSDRRRLQK